MNKNDEKKTKRKPIVKEKTTTKQKTEKSGGKSEKDVRMLATMIVSLIGAFIIGFITAGSIIGILYTLCLAFFLLLARFLDNTKTKKKQRKIANGILIFFLIILILGTLSVGAFFAYIVIDAPSFDVNKLENKESSILYDIEGNEIVRLGTDLRENIEYKDLPEVLVDALVATEDSRFFQHNGFDAPRFLVASFGQVLGKKDAGGGSTLSMQVIKNSLTSRTDSGIEGIIRKFTDIYLAVFKLEKNFTKEEIIEFYINNHCLGNHACGVEQASQTYFGKSVNQINLSEAAMLVGMFQAPSYNNPYLYPNRTAARQKQVLNLMVRHGYITREEADMAGSIPISDLIKGKDESNYEFQGYIDTVLTELSSEYKVDPYTTPMLIYTNMDRAKQKGLDDIFNGVTYKWTKEDVQGGVAVVDVKTGKLVAVGAGRNKSSSRSYNYATQITRQIGSTAKPIFDYAPGIEYLDWSTYQIFVDEEHAYTSGQAINNSDGKFMGPITMRTSLSLSRNIPALKAFQEVTKSVGSSKIIDFATKLGLYPEVENGYLHEAHSLGSFTTKKGTNPLQMASAYAAFANGGYYRKATTINKIVFRDNGDVTTPNIEKVQVMSDATAFMITDMLKTSVESGLASGVKINGVNLAAKTGTTNFDQATMKKYNMKDSPANDAWVVGYDPEYSVSLWYGFDTVDENHYNTSTQAVTQRTKLYKAVGNVVFKKNNQDFQVPSSVTKVGIEIGTNPPLLASDSTPEEQITYEYFKAGTEPTESSTAYQKLPGVTNLKVTYDEANEKVKITWNGHSAPDANPEYGDFGYNVYYENVLLGFTKENHLEISANSNIAGTYKVVTTFEKFTANQSDPVTYKFDYNTSTNPTPGTDKLTLNGTDASIALNATYTDIQNPVKFTNTSVTDDALKAITTAVVTDPTGKTIASFTAGKPVVFTGSVQGDYKIIYSVKYQGKDYSVTRKVTVK